MEIIKISTMKLSYIILCACLYISALLSVISVLFGIGIVMIFPIVIMNILGYCLVYKKYRKHSTLLVKDDLNDMVMLYLCKAGGCWLIALCLCFFMRASLQTRNEVHKTEFWLMVILFWLTPSVKKGVQIIQDTYKYSIINKMNSMSQIEKEPVGTDMVIKKPQHHFIIKMGLNLKKYYSMMNTFFPFLLLIMLYIIPISGDNYYIYDYMEDYEGNFFPFLILPITIIIVNWVYKVFRIRLQILYVINIVLYALVIINYLIFFVEYQYVSMMLIPVLLALFMIILSKSLIDDTTKE